MDIPFILELYETRLKSISFLPLTDHNYPQAPYQEITREAYENAIAKLRPLNFRAMNTDEAQDIYCDGDKCERITIAPLPEQQEVPFDESPVEAKRPDSDSINVPV